MDEDGRGGLQNQRLSAPLGGSPPEGYAVYAAFAVLTPNFFTVVFVHLLL